MDVQTTAVAHVFILGAIVITVATFETAKRKPNFFIQKGYHTPSRSRAIYYNGKRFELDNNDKGENMNNEDLIWLILGASSVAFIFGYFE